jgi:hypothetical protein
MHDLLTSSDEQQFHTHSLVNRCRDANLDAEMIVMSRYLRTWNIPRMPPGGRGVPHPAGLGVLPGDGPLGVTVRWYRHHFDCYPPRRWERVGISGRGVSHRQDGTGRDC